VVEAATHSANSQLKMQIVLLVSVFCALAGSATAGCPFKHASVSLDDAQPVRDYDAAAVEAVPLKVRVADHCQQASGLLRGRIASCFIN
jgi:hypothetical protein